MGTSMELARTDSTALAHRGDDITDVQRLGNILAASGYFSDAREMAQAAVKVMAGKELGIPPVAAMMGINIIKGKVALGGNLIASRVRAHGYEYRHVRFDEKGCTLRFLSKPDTAGKREVLGEASFDENDAKAAGLLASEMYRKYPRNMYFNRAMVNGARWYTPDVFGGAPVYTPEELGARVDADGEVVHSEPTQADVRDAKIEQAREAGIEVSAPKAASKGAVDMKAMMEAFRELKGKFAALAAVGTYYQILGNHGYEHANEIRPLAKAREVYREMALEYKVIETQAARGTGDTTSDRSDWVPDNIGVPDGDGHEQ